MRYFVQENGAGGFETIDRKTGKIVTYSSFYHACDKAVSRLSGSSSWTIEEAERYYGVNRG